MNLATIRRFYAEEIRVVGNIQSLNLIKAFAKVPRENFLGIGPWYYATPDLLNGSIKYRETEDNNPKHLYHDLPIVIDPKRSLPNGQPTAIGSFIDKLDINKGDSVLHIGCGTGYFTAVIAEVVGKTGQVTGIEIEDDLAKQARHNLSYLPQTKVISGDGTKYISEPLDAILVNAGANSICPTWLDNLKDGGRLIVPLTIGHGLVNMGSGMVLKVKRENNGIAAQFISPITIYHCFGARDEEANNRLRTFFMQSRWRDVQSLRQGNHELADVCCLHGEGICLSAVALAETENKKSH